MISAAGEGVLRDPPPPEVSQTQVLRGSIKELGGSTPPPSTPANRTLLSWSFRKTFRLVLEKPRLLAQLESQYNWNLKYKFSLKVFLSFRISSVNDADLADYLIRYSALLCCCCSHCANERTELYDGIILLSATANGLQRMLSCCYEVSCGLLLTFNCSKSYCFVVGSGCKYNIALMRT